MIEIIKDNSKNLQMKCKNCDSIFTYALEDVDKEFFRDDENGKPIFDVYGCHMSNYHFNMVDCPVCGRACKHEDRLKQIIEEE